MSEWYWLPPPRLVVVVVVALDMTWTLWCCWRSRDEDSLGWVPTVLLPARLRRDEEDSREEGGKKGEEEGRRGSVKCGLGMGTGAGTGAAAGGGAFRWYDETALSIIPGVVGE